MERGYDLAFVVGGSEGIGEAVAHKLVTSGARVVILGRSPEKLDAAAERILADATDRSQLRTECLDVRDADATSAVLGQLMGEIGVPDLVVVTAGYAQPGWFDEVDPGDVRGMMETNFFGTYHVCCAVVPEMVRERRGVIVTTSSMAGLTGVFGYTGYCASKFAVLGFSEALRRELRPFGVHVAVLCPPNTRTPGFDEENRHKPAEVLAAEQKVKALEPDQVAAELLRALPRRPRVVIPGRGGRTAYRVMRWLPGLADRILRRPA